MTNGTAWFDEFDEAHANGERCTEGEDDYEAYSMLKLK